MTMMRRRRMTKKKQTRKRKTTRRKRLVDGTQSEVALHHLLQNSNIDAREKRSRRKKTRQTMLIENL
jgi:hypothetical protein